MTALVKFWVSAAVKY